MERNGKESLKIYTVNVSWFILVLSEDIQQKVNKFFFKRQRRRRPREKFYIHGVM